MIITTTTHEDYVIEWEKETNAIIKEPLLHKKVWHINWFESSVIPGYKVENLVAKWATKDFKICRTLSSNAHLISNICQFSYI